MYVPDNLDQFKLWDTEQTRKLEQRTICDYCEEPIQDGHYYLVSDYIVCPDCMDSYFRKEIDT